MVRWGVGGVGAVIESEAIDAAMHCWFLCDK